MSDFTQAKRERTVVGTAYSRSELRELPKVDTIVAGVMSTPAAVILVGGYGLGKTVLAHALGCSVATGTPFLGRPVNRRKVLFVIGEGAYGQDARIGAWEHAYHDGRPVSDSDATFLVKPDSLKETATWQAITAYAVSGGYGFTILDTFSSLAPDADETKDAGIVMRHLSDLSAATTGTAMLVHHPGWSDATRTRGGYQLEANADEVLVMTEVSKDSTLVCVTRKKVKDGPSGSTIWLNRTAEFGSVIFESASPDDANVPLRSRILTVLAGYGDVGATGPQMMAELKVPDENKSGFYKALRKLVEEELVTPTGTAGKQRYYLPGVVPLYPKQ